MFFDYRQNNSGGSFIVDEERGISVNVIIEASNAKDADEIARSKGIYFNGVSDGFDCECCGDRWYPNDNYLNTEEGDPVPSLYGTPLTERKSYIRWAAPDTFIHYLDGRVEGFTVPTHEELAEKDTSGLDDEA